MEGNKLTLIGSELLKDTLTSQVPKIGVELPAQKLVGETTAQKSLEKVWELLMDGESRVVGVYGMGGIGKTKMAMVINNRILEKSNQFDKIIWVTLSKARDIHGLQIDIAKKVDLDLSNEQDEIQRMGKLHEALKRRKRILFILDDMWQEFPLGEIGIPEPTIDNGCKILITTRKKEVCNKMGCRAAIVKVETLTEEEAWELFLDKVDELTPEVMSTAKLVAKECSGLPLAIITVAAAMRGNCDLGDWTVALNDLRNFSNRIIDSEDIVFERLKFSYDRLPNEKLKKSFLCCALYPEDYEILARELVDFWIMDGMVEGRSRQDELLEGQFILKKLKDHCLLESVEIYDDYYNEMSDGVKMHDLIRDMALRITRKHFMVKAGSLLEVLPNEVAWEEVLERASFMKNRISKVSISPRCPNLSTLFLGGNSFISSITHDFFIHMQCLRKVPSLAKLVRLRRLELNNTAIEELPEGMEMLGKLNCLNLHLVSLRETIPVGLISKLSALQELYLGGIKVDKLYDVGSGESFANELLSLKELENLNTSFHCLSDYASYVGSSKFNGLKCFYLAVGEEYNYREYHLGIPPRATVQLSYSDEGSAQNAHFFPQNTKRVGINWFNDLTRLNELGWLIKDVRELVAFTINQCNKIECIWWWSSSEDEKEEELSLSGIGTGTGTSSTCWLQYLERIDIYECPKLYTFFKGIPIPPSFFCLKELRIYGCHNLKNVLSSSRLLQLLQNLEEIWVIRCDELEELIGEEEEEEENRRNVETPIAVQFSKIKKLVFRNLPKLKSIWRGVMICDSLKEVWVLPNCSELKKLPQFKGEDQSIQPPASLKEIQGTRKWWDSLEWDPAYPQNILQPFFIELQGNIHTVTSCDNCKMKPIVGKRYKCKECYEERVVGTEGWIGFDLCEECYNTPSKHSDFVNQHNTKGHTFELIANRGDSPVPVHTVEEQNNA
ncbi:hypothetical protein AQUCO_06700049v1 [Aquilegia coerulea]|uniref:ZZ-type domain-containing protein n=1 Tax=Aquilegia coerulea TaxID=218851 RepID=A0A2G5CBV5_AQUCA|nr:hypothetical protein AQUCO_06700049v1 [Aquilegia coerulea]